MINSYLNYIQENKQITVNSNSSCAAYEAVYEKKCPHDRGRYFKSHKTKEWDGMIVDGHLKDKWLDELKSIKEIEVRASCEGHGDDWVTYISFRLTGKPIPPKMIEKKLEASDKITKVSGHKGRGGQVRFIVAAALWYGEPGWEKWWKTLASRIKAVVK